MLRPSELHRNVKLGYGGIREVEFVVQALQVLHGAKHPFLQERSTLKTLAELGRVRIFPETDLAQLRNSYIFLRTVEHRLQIQHEQQTHTLPTDADGLLLIARSLGFPTVENFNGKFSELTESVRTIFDRFFRSRAEPIAQNPVFSVAFVADEDVKKTLAALRDGPANVHVAPRTKRLYSQLEPQLLEWCRKLADPDAVISRFARFVDKYGIRGLLFETLLANPKLLELLVRLFDASAAASEIVIRRPQLIEEIARGKNLGRALSREEFLEGLLKDPISESLDWMRVFRREEGVRILLADILGFSSQSTLQTEMTYLAEASLDYCAGILKGGSELTIVALGKFGGRELLYGADLDLVLIGTDQSAGGQLIHSMTSMRADGRVFPIDCRLRPDGEKGILVTSLSGYRTYLEDRAQLWEIQALTKARAVRGPEAAATENLIREVWLRRGADTELRQKILRMYRRIVKERSKGESMLNFKTGDGGLIAIEFLMQYLQMKHQIREPNTLEAIGRFDSALSQDEKTTLRDSYSFLRRVESTLRRMNDNPISVLPSAELEQAQLALRLGFPSKQAFLDDYGAKRQKAATIVDAHLGNS
ncbi:MAG: hypothetical protein JO076_09100 [Verrucomicrobia bacterium]|nr:hypothetical protein [Verrucomicrobiota bacterium]